MCCGVFLITDENDHIYKATINALLPSFPGHLWLSGLHPQCSKHEGNVSTFSQEYRGPSIGNTINRKEGLLL